MIQELITTTEEKWHLLKEKETLLEQQKVAIKSESLDLVKTIDQKLLALRTDLAKCDARFLQGYSLFKRDILPKGHYDKEERESIRRLQDWVEVCMELELTLEKQEEENSALRKAHPDIGQKLKAKRLGNQLKKKYGK